MTIKKKELNFLLAGIKNQCGIEDKDIEVEHNSVYGYQLLIDNTRTAGLSSFKDKEFEGYLKGFKDSCSILREYSKK